MGLDISVYKTKSFDEFKKFEELKQLVEDEAERVWQENTGGMKYDEIPQELKDETSKKSKEAQKAKAKELGLEFSVSGYGFVEVDNPHIEPLDVESKVHPKHELFTPSYFRSSYNSSGINRVLEDRIGMSLYTIFPEAETSDYYVRADWEGALERVNEAIDLFKQSVQDFGTVRVMESSANEFMRLEDSDVRSAHDAMQAYVKEVERHKEQSQKNGWDSYGNAKGDFYLGEPLKVKAVIRGVRRPFMRGSDLMPMSYIIYETGEDNMRFYLEALEIIKETCEMAVNDTEHEYFLGWSG